MKISEFAERLAKQGNNLMGNVNEINFNNKICQ